MEKISPIRWLRLIGFSLLGGFLAGMLVVLFLRQRQSAERSGAKPEITLAEVSL
jgi:hypothetical protein